MPKYVGALDQGTTSTRFMIFDHGGQVVAIHQKEHEQIYPKPGWVEHDPAEIWARSQEVIKGALEKAGIAASDLAAVGITNQRETTVVSRWFVIPTAARSVALILALSSAPVMTSWLRAQISDASCSTQPGFG